jgi:hypothetical protein
VDSKAIAAINSPEAGKAAKEDGYTLTAISSLAGPGKAGTAGPHAEDMAAGLEAGHTDMLARAGAAHTTNFFFHCLLYISFLSM